MRSPRFVLAVALAGLVACSPDSVTIGTDVPEDLRAVVTSALEDIETALPAHRACLATVTVRHAWDLHDRAHYLPAEATIVLRVPATAHHLAFSLAHEIAHHLEFACSAQADMRPGFLTSQGLSQETEWFEGRTWEETPSEQFATAFALLVTGRNDPRRPVVITDEALAVIEDWGRGDTFRHGPSTP